MYKAVFEAMVEAGVAIRHNEKVMLDHKGNVTQSIDQMFSRKTKYQLLKPERCVYVYESGCNTNIKEDGHIGGRRYVMAADQFEGARTGVTNDLHFIVLAFTARTGEAILCAAILKSKKSVSNIPISWKVEIDVARDIKK
jgi:hypothetical protein